MMEPMQMQLNNNRRKKTFFFQDTSGRQTNLIVDEDITIKELIDKYMNRVYGYENEDLVFIINANNIDRNSQIKLREYYWKILVLKNLNNFSLIKNNVNNEHEKKRECNYDKKESEKNIKGNEEL